MLIFTIYALILLLIALAAALAVMRGNRMIAMLHTEAPPPTGAQPLVSIVVAGRNEQASIAATVRALFALDYPRYEVWVVNDRSEDNTGSILAGLQREYPQLNVLTIEQLPPGWLGKTHALHQGAQRCGGEWLLFTDADVMLEPTTLGRALGYIHRHSVEHLAVSPEVIARGVGLNAFLNFAAFVAMAVLSPWRVREPASSQSIGVGAFNLVRRDAYLRLGGHRPLAMRPDDDLMLGRALKRAGVRQDFVFGRGLVKVEWYPSLRALIAGLEKNLFAAHAYRTSIVVADTVVVLGVFVAPFLLALAVPALAGWLGAAAAAALVLAAA